jgi:hypothetical protein
MQMQNVANSSNLSIIVQKSYLLITTSFSIY